MQEQLSLGDLIDALKQRDAAEDVIYDFGGFNVGKIGSYRGHYDQLAIGFAEEGPARTVGDLLAECENAVGRTFQGYKGGDFTMDRGTPLWVANLGRCHDTAIVGVLDGRWRTILATGFAD